VETEEKKRHNKLVKEAIKKLAEFYYDLSLELRLYLGKDLRK